MHRCSRRVRYSFAELLRMHFQARHMHTVGHPGGKAESQSWPTMFKAVSKTLRAKLGFGSATATKPPREFGRSGSVRSNLVASSDTEPQNLATRAIVDTDMQLFEGSPVRPCQPMPPAAHASAAHASAACASAAHAPAAHAPAAHASGSPCLGSPCPGSPCLSSPCPGSSCLGSPCLGSLCLGSRRDCKALQCVYCCRCLRSCCITPVVVAFWR